MLDGTTHAIERKSVRAFDIDTRPDAEKNAPLLAAAGPRQRGESGYIHPRTGT